MKQFSLRPNLTLYIFISLLLCFHLNGISQKTLVEEKLKAYGIEDDYFANNISEEDATHAFKAKITVETSTETTVNEASFDPRKPDGEKWELNSVNGNPPTKKEIKNFLKEHNSSDDDIDFEESDDDWSIVKDDDHLLVIGFRYSASNLPHKYKFLAQCNAEIYIDKEAKRLYKVRFYNTGELKIKIFKVVKLDMTMKFEEGEETGSYLINEEDMVIDVKILGQIEEITNNTVFYDYEKVK